MQDILRCTAESAVEMHVYRWQSFVCLYHAGDGKLYPLQLIVIVAERDTTPPNEIPTYVRSVLTPYSHLVSLGYVTEQSG
jgi:hypothetical protein